MEGSTSGLLLLALLRRAFSFIKSEGEVALWCRRWVSGMEIFRDYELDRTPLPREQSDSPP